MLCFRTIGGHRRFLLIEIIRIRDGKKRKLKLEKPAIYARVSSHEQKQKGDLDSQITTLREFCPRKGRIEAQIYKDVGSGLNTKRKRFLKLKYVKTLKRGRRKSSKFT